MSACPRIYPKLSQPVWLAARLKTEAAAHRFAGAMKRMDLFYRACEGTRHDFSRSEMLALYSIVPSPALFDVPLVLAEPDFHGCSTHIMPTALDAGRVEPAVYLRQFATRLAGDLPPVWKMPPPVAYVCHFTRMDAIYAATDFFGSGRVYYCADPDLDLFASALAPIALAGKGLPETDDDAWASYAAFDWLLDDRTFFKGVSVLPPGATARLTRAQAGWVRSHDYAAVLQNGISRASQSDAIEAGQSILSAAARITTDQPPRIGLSGGRDSRLVAAMAIDLGLDARYDTFWPPDIDAEIAEDLVGKAPGKLDWTKNRYDPEQVPSGGIDFETSAAYWFQLFEGDGWPSNVGRLVPGEHADPQMSPYQRWNMSDHPGQIARWNFSGWAGEIVRQHFYGRNDLSAPKKRIKAFLAYRRRIPEILSQSAREVSAGMLENIISEGRALGLAGLHLLDWIYVRSQQRRRVPVAHSPGAVFPLFTPQMFLAGFRSPPEEKITGRLVQGMTADLIPAWGDVPYFDDLAAQRPVSEINKTLSRRLYWEANRAKYLAAMEQGLQAMQQHFREDALEAFAAVDRSHSNAAQLQNISNRLLWRLGFTDFLRRIAEVQQAVGGGAYDLPPATTVDTKFA